MARGRKHVVIPDTQVKPGVPTDHIQWLAQFIIDKLPDVIVIIGDWFDMPSLSSYDKGKKSFEGRTYLADIKAGNDALKLLMEPIQVEIKRRESLHRKRWNPRLVCTLGNHEYRIVRTVEIQRELDGVVSLDHLDFAKWGFEVYPFLQPVTIDGVCYCHYFASGPKGQPIGSARQLILKNHMSCIAGHQQGKDLSYDKRPDGSTITTAIVGSFYEHQELYMGPQGNQHWRGILTLHEVNNGSFDEMLVSLSFLKDRYGQIEKRAEN